MSTPTDQLTITASPLTQDFSHNLWVPNPYYYLTGQGPFQIPIAEKEKITIEKLKSIYDKMFEDDTVHLFSLSNYYILFHEWDIKQIAEFVTYLKQKMAACVQKRPNQAINFSLFNWGSFQGINTESYNSEQKKDYCEKLLLLAGLKGFFSVAPDKPLVPFSMSIEECQILFENLFNIWLNSLKEFPTPTARFEISGYFPALIKNCLLEPSEESHRTRLVDWWNEHQFMWLLEDLKANYSNPNFAHIHFTNYSLLISESQAKRLAEFLQSYKNLHLSLNVSLGQKQDPYLLSYQSLLQALPCPNISLNIFLNREASEKIDTKKLVEFVTFLEKNTKVTSLQFSESYPFGGLDITEFSNLVDFIQKISHKFSICLWMPNASSFAQIHWDERGRRDYIEALIINQKLLHKKQVGFSIPYIFPFTLNLKEWHDFLDEFMKRCPHRIIQVLNWLKGLDFGLSESETEGFRNHYYQRITREFEGSDVLDILQLKAVLLPRDPAREKTWDQKSRDEHIQKFLFAESLSNPTIMYFTSNEKLFPFPLSLEEWKTFCNRYLETCPSKVRQLHNWLIRGADFGLSLDETNELRNHGLLLIYKESNQISELELTSFIGKVDAERALISVMREKNPFAFYRVSVNLNTHKKVDIHALNKLLTTLKQTPGCQNLKCIEFTIPEAMNAFQMGEFIEMVQQFSEILDGIEIRGPLGKNPPELLFQLSEALKEWYSVNIESTQLQALNDTDFLRFSLKILEGDKIKALNLSKNEVYKRDLKLLAEIIEFTKKKQNFQSLCLWMYEFTEKPKWDEAYCVEFVKLLFELEHVRKRSERSSPCYGLVKPEQEFEFLCQYIQTFKDKLYKIGAWIKDSIINDEQRLSIAERYVAATDDIVDLNDFKLQASDSLRLFLINIGNIGFEVIVEPSACIGALETLDFKDKVNIVPLLSAWTQFFERLNEGIDREFDYLTSEGIQENCDFAKLLPLIQNPDGLISGLQKGTEALFGSETRFHSSCFDKCKSFKVKEGRIHDIYKWLLLLQWYTWLMISIHLAAKETPKILDDFSRLLREMADLADFKLRYELGKTFCSTILPNKQAQSLYLGATEKAKTKMILPTVFLSQMVVNDSASKVVPETKGLAEVNADDTTTSDTIRNTISKLPSEYDLGHHLRSFLAALHSLTLAKDLTFGKKLALVEGILHRSNTIEKIKAYFHQIKNKELTAAQIRVDLQALFPNEYEELQKHLPSRYFEKPAIPLKNEDLNTIVRTITTQYTQAMHKTQLRSQIANWYLVQGFGLLGELSLLSTIKPEEYQTAVFSILQRIFDLSSEHIKYYQSNIETKRNAAGILTYHAILRAEGPVYTESFKEYIRSVLTPDSREFYEKRRDPSRSPHLTQVFKDRPALKILWGQIHSENFNDFIQKHQIKARSTTVNYVKYFHERIFLHPHFPAVRCKELKHYIDNIANKEALAKIKASLKAQVDAILKENIALETKEGAEGSLQTTSKKPKIRAEFSTETKASLFLQYHIIELIETDPVDKPAQIKRIYTLIGILKQGFKGAHYQLQSDLSSLLNSFRSSDRVMDPKQTTGWKIGITNNYWSLFMSGTDVEGSCQKIDGSSKLNKCLLAYMKDGKNMMVYIEDETGKTMARSFLRLLRDELDEKPVLCLSDFYPSFLTSQQRDALIKTASLIAEDLGLFLVSREGTENSTTYPNSVVSESGEASEYVDELYGVFENGIFTIDNLEVLFDPRPRFENVLKEAIPGLQISEKESATAQSDKEASKSQSDSSKTTQTDIITSNILEYWNPEEDPRYLAKPMHFSWQNLDEALRLAKTKPGEKTRVKTAAERVVFV